MATGLRIYRVQLCILQKLGNDSQSVDQVVPVDWPKKCSLPGVSECYYLI